MYKQQSKGKSPYQQYIPMSQHGERKIYEHESAHKIPRAKPPGLPSGKSPGDQLAGRNYKYIHNKI